MFKPIGDESQYFFDESAGEDIPVYIVDTGANLRHPVSRLTHIKSFIFDCLS